MNKLIKKNFSDNIKVLRIKEGWTQKEVADSIGISVPAYSKIETGFTDINLSRLIQIADIFKVEVADLFVRNGLSSSAGAFNYNTFQEKHLNKEMEISNLQRKVIELYEELRKKELINSGGN